SSFSIEITWWSGFADEVRIEGAPEIGLAELYRRLLALPLARFMTSLVVGHSGDRTYKPLLSAMAELAPPPHLRSLVLGDVRPGYRIAVDNPVLQATLDRVPTLVRLELRNAHGLVGPLASDQLRELVLVDTGQRDVANDLYEVTTSELPALVELTVLRGYARALLRGLVGTPLLRTVQLLTLRHCQLEDRELALV